MAAIPRRNSSGLEKGTGQHGLLAASWLDPFGVDDEHGATKPAQQATEGDKLCIGRNWASLPWPFLGFGSGQNLERESPGKREGVAGQQHAGGLALRGSRMHGRGWTAGGSGQWLCSSSAPTVDDDQFPKNPLATFLNFQPSPFLQFPFLFLDNFPCLTRLDFKMLLHKILNC